MAKKSRAIETGLLDGADVRINTVHNEGLSEYVVVINVGSVPQPMGGWVLASLRGAAFYQFPEELILLPSRVVIIYSGRDQVELAAQHRLVWTEEQIWNNRHDVALLFDAAGCEVDRYSYPSGNSRGSQRKRLIENEDSWYIEDEPRSHPQGLMRMAGGKR